MKTNLKDDIWIEGFKKLENAKLKFEALAILKNGTIYVGKTEAIPEEIKLEYSPYHKQNQNISDYCFEEYCIIYKS